MSCNSGTTIHRTFAARAISTTLVVLALGGTARAGNLTNTAVTGDDFAAAFNLAMHTKFLETKFKLADGETEGVFRSEVFNGKGDNAGIYAYVYQIMAPSQTAISQFFIDVLDKKLTTTAKVKNADVSSIYLTDLGSGGNIDGFKVVGTVAPTRVFVSDAGGEGVLFDYSGGKIPAGDTGYVVAVFSTKKPQILTDLVINDKIPGEINYYTAAPEPGSLALLLLGTIAVTGVRSMRRFGIRRAGS